MSRRGVVEEWGAVLGLGGGTGRRHRVVGSVVVVLLIFLAVSPHAAGRPAAGDVDRAPQDLRNAAGESACPEDQLWKVDWSPDQTDDTGFRVWVCTDSADVAASVQGKVLAMGSRLWALMTVPEPDGMGLPIPDTGARDNGGNGKIDVYVLGRTDCVLRDGKCLGIDEKSAVAVSRSVPASAVPGRPRAKSGLLRLSLDRLQDPSITSFVADFVHEFFHVLQFAHNALPFDHWYEDASATWAEWAYVRAETTTDIYDHFRRFQETNTSLLAQEDPGTHQYQSWVWPLFQETHAAMGAPSVFSTWQAAESVTTREQMDAVVDESLRFKSFYRDFAVTNLQPRPYDPATSSGLEEETWQLRAGRDDFPRNQHVLTHRAVRLTQGTSSKAISRYRANVAALAAQYDEFVVGAGIHQITIDVGSLRNAGNADLDVVGRLNGDGGTEWMRIAATGREVTLCLDEPTEDVNRFYVLVSNHAVARTGEGPNPKQTVKGSYKITTKRACDLIPTTITGTAHAQETWYDIVRNTVLGVSGFTIDMTGTFTLNRDTWEHGLATYDFVGDITYSYDGYNDLCERFWVEPTVVPGEASITLWQDGKNLKYYGDGLIALQYDENYNVIGPIVEEHFECGGESWTEETGTGAAAWLELQRDAGGPLTSDGLRLNGTWTNTAYLGDPDDNIDYEWDFVGECPCPPVG